MRKFLFTLWMLLVCCTGYAQTIDALFDEFGGERNADYVKVSPLMMSIGKMFCKHDEGMEGLHKIRSDAPSVPKDTCSTPEEAYVQAQRALVLMSSSLNKGLEEIETIHETTGKVKENVYEQLNRINFVKP